LGYFLSLSWIGGIGALKDIDMENMSEDPQEVMDMFTRVIENWLRNNPEKAREIALEIVALTREYKTLL